MTKEGFLHWAAQYKHTADVRMVVRHRKFSEAELDALKKQMEPNVVPLAATADRMRRVGA